MPTNDIYKLGYTQSLTKPALFSDTVEIVNRFSDGTASQTIQSGDLNANVNVVAGYLQSSNFVTGSTGWQINSDGDVEFNDGTFRGALSASTIDIGTGFHVDTSGNVWWGSSTTYAGATIKISSAGSVNFTTGTFAGTLSAAAGTLGIITAGTIKANTSTWIGDISGHSGISLNGTTDYNNIFFRRNSDSVVFFRVNSGGAQSLTFDSSSGVLALSGKITTNATGYRIIIDPATRAISYYNSATYQGAVKCTADKASMQIDTADDIYFTTNSTSRIKIDTAGDINYAGEAQELAWPSGRKLFGASDHIECNGGFTSNSDDSDFLGSASKRWKTIYGVDIYGTTHDIVLSDSHCPICEKEFEDGDIKVLIQYKHSTNPEEPNNSNVPIHYACVKNYKKTLHNKMKSFTETKNKEYETLRGINVDPISDKEKDDRNRKKAEEETLAREKREKKVHRDLSPDTDKVQDLVK